MEDEIPRDRLRADHYETIIAAARAGADWAWTAIYRDLAPDVLRYARAKRCPEPEDIVGDVFVRVVRALPEFSGDAPDFRSWVFTIAHNRIADAWRRDAGRTPEPVDVDVLDTRASGDSDPEHASMSRFSDTQVRDLIGRLPVAQRDVLFLRVLIGLSLEETAAVTGRSSGAVKSLQHRALASIRKRMCT